jgi:hypothetical protein
MTRTTVPDITVVVVSWNARAYLERCLAAIRPAAGSLLIEVLVVDNGSTDGSQAMVAERFPGVRLIQNSENVGYGRAVNIGARAGSGRSVLILNSDCEPAPGALAAMHAALTGDDGIGGVFCKLVNADGSLQPLVHERFPSPWSLLGDLIGLPALRHAVYRRPGLHRWLLGGTRRFHGRERDVAWGGGACLLVRRKAFEAVEGFDERFFLYYEDMDLCHRLRDAGHRLRYLPTVSALHHWGASTGQAPPAVLAEACRSRIEYFEKYFPGWGGEWARWTAVAELFIRRTVLGMTGVVSDNAGRRAKIEAVDNCLVRHRRARAGARDVGASVFPALLWLAVIFGLARYAHDMLKFLLQSSFIDFAHYYTFTTIVSQGLDAYDPQIVQRMDAVLQLHRAGGGADYPPLFYVLMTPWTWLPFRAASVAWFLAGQVCLAAAIALCASKTTVVTPVRFALVALLALNFQPVLETVVLGQSNGILFLLLAAAWLGLRNDRPWLVAASLSLAVHIKIQYILLVALLGWMGASRAFVRTLAVYGAGIGAALAVVGPAHYRGYVDLLLESSAVYADWILNLSLRAGLYRLLDVSGALDLVADGLWMAAGAVTLVLLARALGRTDRLAGERLDWAWGAGIAAVMLLSPMTEEHHLVVLLLPLTHLLLSSHLPPVRAFRGMLLAASIVLLGARYSLNQFPVFHHGLYSLAMMGKTAGIVGVLAVLLLQLREFGADAIVQAGTAPAVRGEPE